LKYILYMLDNLFDAMYNKKFFIVMALITFGLGISFSLRIYYLEYSNPKVIDTIVILVGLLIFFIVMAYLQSGEEEKIAVHDIYELKRLEKKIDSTIEEIKTIESKNTFTDDEKNTLKTNIIDKVQTETIKAIFDENLNKLTEISGLETIKNSFHFSIKRINEEIRKLNLRANISLTIGMIISFLGIYMLFISIDMFNSESFLTYSHQGERIKKDSIEIFIQMLPRLSFVFIIELFAYFFLQLYKTGLDEIKYFQNELTNIESKLIAVEVAYITKNDESMKEALKVLVETERNFILKKGESTIELKREKIESNNIKDVLKEISSFLKTKS